MSAVVTEAQLKLMKHALGYAEDRRTIHRNRYISGPGHYALEDLRELERLGYMEERRLPLFAHPGDIMFVVTPAGIEYLEGLIQK